jgi:hypothetical protein
VIDLMNTNPNRNGRVFTTMSYLRIQVAETKQLQQCEAID